MSIERVAPQIPESAFEHKTEFSSHWISRWVAPNPFIALLYNALRRWDVGLEDFSFGDGKSLADIHLLVSIKKQQAFIKIGLDYVSCLATNPDWDDAEALIALITEVQRAVESEVESSPRSQEASLAFHLTLGGSKLRESTRSLVNHGLFDEAESYGISTYEAGRTRSLEKSLRYDDALFIRLSRKFAATTSYEEVAVAMYEEELKVLDVLNVKVEGVA